MHVVGVWVTCNWHTIGMWWYVGGMCDMCVTVWRTVPRWGNWVMCGWHVAESELWVLAGSLRAQSV